ncbi:hypothetical protein D3C73_636410 [compost metagenome]
MLQKLCLNVSKLNPVTANFDLMIAASKKLNDTVRHPSGQITCLVHPGIRNFPLTVGIANEPFPGKPCICIPGRQAFTANIQISGNKRRTRLQPLVQNVVPCILNRCPVRNADPLLLHLADRIKIRPNGGLRRSP